MHRGNALCIVATQCVPFRWGTGTSGWACPPWKTQRRRLLNLPISTDSLRLRHPTGYRLHGDGEEGVGAAGSPSSLHLVSGSSLSLASTSRTAPGTGSPRLPTIPGLVCPLPSLDTRTQARGMWWGVTLSEASPHTTQLMCPRTHYFQICTAGGVWGAAVWGIEAPQSHLQGDLLVKHQGNGGTPDCANQLIDFKKIMFILWPCMGVYNL